MKKFSMKVTISTLVTTLIVSGIIYAANISTVTTQSIVQGDIMEPGWFQMVNDKILSMPAAQKGSVLYAKSLNFNSSQSWNDTMNAYISGNSGTSWASITQQKCLTPNSTHLPVPYATGDTNNITFCGRIACIQKWVGSYITPLMDYCANADNPECPQTFSITARCVTADNPPAENF